MKSLRFLPLTFLAGIDGFHFFAPYTAAVFVAVGLLRLIQRSRETVVASRLAVDALPDDAEPVVAGFAVR